MSKAPPATGFYLRELTVKVAMKLHVKRSTFVIGENGTIEQALYGVNARGHVDSLRETLGV